MTYLFLKVVSIVLISSTVAAAPAPTNPKGAHSETFAEGLFRSGRELMEAGKIGEACEKFAASYQLDPALGTLLNLAVCHEKQGKTATAWTEFSNALAIASQTGQKDREALARSRISALKPKLTRAIVAVSAPAQGLEIRIDGNLLPAAAWDSPMPMDPGQHSVEASAPGRQKWQQTWQISNNSSTPKITIPALEKLAVSKQPIEKPPAPPGVSAAAPESSSQRRTLGYVLDATGGACLITGLIVGISAKKSYDEAKNEKASQEAFDNAKSSAKSKAIAADILFGLGAASLGTGLYFTLTSPGSSTTASVTAAPTQNGGAIVVNGAF